MNRICLWLLLLFCLSGTHGMAGGIGRAIARGAVRSSVRSTERSAGRSVVKAAERKAVQRAIEIQRRDLWNHRHSLIRPLPATRNVYRYTTASRARREIHAGIAPGRHMAATAPAGRLPSPKTAANRYGLPTTPTVRETIRLPKGFPTRHNKVPGGEPGVGEITSSRRIPPEAIKKVTQLR